LLIFCWSAGRWCNAITALAPIYCWPFQVLNIWWPMPLFWFIFVSYKDEGTSTTYISLAGVCVVDGLEDDWKLVWRGDELLWLLWLKSVKELCHWPSCAVCTVK
jgi:hypothetical protein